MKYKQDLSVLPQIIGFLKTDPTFIDFIKKDFVLLVPATKKNRQFQPVEVIADAISKEFCVPVIKGMIEAENHTEIKHVEKAKKIDILKSSYTYCEHPEINYHMSLGAVKNRLKILFDEIGVGDKQGFLNKYSDYEICYGDDFSSIKKKLFNI